jgi:solute carrier family 12 sodium/potassium/chloride transporter 2
MTILLSKFRIDYSDLVIINDADEAPKEKTKKWFNGIIQPLLKPGTNGLH